MSDIRDIKVEAFVHIDTFTTKLGDNAWERKLCGFSQNRRVYRFHTPAKGTVVENRNVTVVETPPCSHLLIKGVDYLDDEEEPYARDVIDLHRLSRPN